jgi:sulfur-oxidizing protein SoxY
MDRRSFFTLAGSAFALSALPVSLSAADYRKMKPTVWTAHKVDDAIKALYGNKPIAESNKVKIKTPKVNSSGSKVPVSFSTTIPVKTVALFQDANPESAVAVFTVTEYDLTDYEVKIKMGKSGTITVVVEGQDGKLYMAKQATDVAAGGCEG